MTTEAMAAEQSLASQKAYEKAAFKLGDFIVNYFELLTDHQKDCIRDALGHKFFMDVEVAVSLNAKSNADFEEWMAFWGGNNAKG